MFAGAYLAREPSEEMFVGCNIRGSIPWNHTHQELCIWNTGAWEFNFHVNCSALKKHKLLLLTKFPAILMLYYIHLNVHVSRIGAYICINSPTMSHLLHINYNSYWCHVQLQADPIHHLNTVFPGVKTFVVV